MGKRKTIDGYCGLSGALIVRMPRAAMEECSMSGACDAAVAYWEPRVDWVADAARLRSFLRECGAWDDLDTAEEVTLRERALWVAANDAAERGE